MKKHLPLIFSVFTICSCFTGFAQDRFAYAITDIKQEGINWSYLRKLDLKSGAFSDVLLNGTDASRVSYDAATHKEVTPLSNQPQTGNMANAPFGTGVAALAYDKRNNRLYYTPMFVDQLRYIDLKSMKVFFVNNTDLTGMKVKASDQSNIVTRMAIASDGFGYALTNDGNHLIRFSTGKKVSITNLGALIDDASNDKISVHNSCSSYGGDMVADDDGNLYIFSARNHVFKVNISTKTATHLGTIQGLPATYTVNGAAIDDNNQVLVSSAVDNSSLYTLDTKTWIAKATKPGPWRIADLANSNLLASRAPSAPVKLLAGSTGSEDNRVQLFPNPVTSKQFNLQFDLPDGRYTLQLTDALGRQVTQSVVNIRGKGQLEKMKLSASTKAGVYELRVVDRNKKDVYMKKVLVQ